MGTLWCSRGSGRIVVNRGRGGQPQGFTHPLCAPQPQLRDAVVRRLSVVHSAHPSRLEALNVRYVRRQGQVLVRVVLLEGFRVLRVPEHGRELQLAPW